MALYDRKTDPQKEADGEALDFGDYRVTIARAGGANARYGVELERLSKPYRRAIALGSLDPDKDQEIMMKVYARTIVQKWETKLKSMRKPPEGVTAGPDGFVRGIDLNGKLVPDTEEHIIKIFTDLPGVYRDIQHIARGEDLFRLEQREDDSGN